MMKGRSGNRSKNPPGPTAREQVELEQFLPTLEGKFGPKRRLSVLLDGGVLDTLHEYAGEHGISLAEAITRLARKL